MKNMETLLRKLFDYFKFAGNAKLEKTINDISLRSEYELSDELLSSIAGGLFVDDKDKKDNGK